MSAVIAQVNISSLLPKPKPITESVVVGKDILELLAGSMYVDPMNIYREYIQNAADAIDEARDSGLLFEDGANVRISFDHTERTIKIRDDGISIPANEFARRLVTIGASQKRGTKLRGFRGVGRLSGLGYCQELIFRGRADGDSRVTEVHWNGRGLRERMRDQQFTGDLSALIKEVVTTNTISGDGLPGRFFEVELRKISRLRNDILLNEEAVRSYVSQVAPVPFSDEFAFAREIDEALEKFGVRPPIRIELNDGNGPIVHRIQDSIEFSESVVDPIRGIEFISLAGMDGEICAFGWIADHSYGGAIPKRLGLGGIRLRAGNIQVGDETILASLFPESRFASWAIGDIHVISPKILPNGRRDDFEPTASYAHLQSELALQAKLIAQRIRDRSAKRNQLRVVQQHFGAIEVWLKAAKEQQLPRIVLQVLQELSQERFEKVTKEIERFPQDSAERSSAQEKLSTLSKTVTGLTSHGKGKKTLSIQHGHFERPISAVLRTILSNAKSADAGIGLSLEVLAAFEVAC